MKRAFKISVIAAVLLTCVVTLFAPGGRLNVREITPFAFGPTIPMELSIPRIGVRALIEPVKTVNGAMAVPTSAHRVGWYDMGTRPGDTGAAVLAGHVNWIHGADAVFTNLHLMQIGDVASVMDTRGATDQFIVRDIKRYAFDDDTSAVFSSTDNGAYLRLITCDGEWSNIKGTHESRLVVFLEKI